MPLSHIDDDQATLGNSAEEAITIKLNALIFQMANGVLSVMVKLKLNWVLIENTVVSVQILVTVATGNQSGL